MEATPSLTSPNNVREIRVLFAATPPECSALCPFVSLSAPPQVTNATGQWASSDWWAVRPALEPQLGQPGCYSFCSNRNCYKHVTLLEGRVHGIRLAGFFNVSLPVTGSGCLAVTPRGSSRPHKWIKMMDKGHSPFTVGDLLQ